MIHRIAFTICFTEKKTFYFHPKIGLEPSINLSCWVTVWSYVRRMEEEWMTKFNWVDSRTVTGGIPGWGRCHKKILVLPKKKEGG